MIYALGCGKYVELRIGDAPPRYYKDTLVKRMKQPQITHELLTPEEEKKVRADPYGAHGFLRLSIDPKTSRLRHEVIKYVEIDVPLVSATGWDGGTVLEAISMKTFQRLSGRKEVLKEGTYVACGVLTWATPITDGAGGAQSTPSR